MMNTENPYLKPAVPIPFDQLALDQIEPAIAELLAESNAAFEAIEADESIRTYDNTLEAMELATETLDRAAQILHLQDSVMVDDNFREIFNRIMPRLNQFFAGIPLREKLWAAIQAFAETDEAAGLSGSRARLLKKQREEFVRAGAELQGGDRERLSVIDLRLSELTIAFGQNGLDSQNAFELVLDNEQQLAGLPADRVAAAAASARDKGLDGWRFTLQAPSFSPVMTYLDNRDIREEMYRAYSTTATEGEFDNTPLIDEILALRSEKATLLGYDDFADLVLEGRMAGSGARAWEFVRELRSSCQSWFDKEIQELAEFATQQGGFAGAELEAWDAAYYAEKMRQVSCDFDEEALRPYFEVERVMAGAFDTATRLYGVTFEPAPELPVWHDSIRAYQLFSESGEALAWFYVDLFPRETKRGGAWMHPLATGVKRGEVRTPHLALMAANVTAPQGDSPGLLNLREVETIFHEFGHLMHHCLSEVDVRSLGGTDVAWDFVELPSQIMENWVWERESLDCFARHYQTGEAIPEALFDAMGRARTFRAATATMRQLSFAVMDLSLHTQYHAETGGSVLAYARAALLPMSPTSLPENYAMVASFGHLFADPVGYAAGYYSYKWAEVLEADAFGAFKADGIYSREIGDRFRSTILSRGNTADAMSLYEDFLGRGPDMSALLQRMGLAA
ncbi:MAG: oligopeptidase A [Halieaceae bacterium]|jgi:oligopeptidase A